MKRRYCFSARRLVAIYLIGSVGYLIGWHIAEWLF